MFGTKEMILILSQVFWTPLNYAEERSPSNSSAVNETFRPFHVWRGVTRMHTLWLGFHIITQILNSQFPTRNSQFTIYHSQIILNSQFSILNSQSNSQGFTRIHSSSLLNTQIHSNSFVSHHSDLLGFTFYYSDWLVITRIHKDLLVITRIHKDSQGLKRGFTQGLPRAFQCTHPEASESESKFNNPALHKARVQADCVQHWLTILGSR
jgi:hypothetical protein